MPIGRFIAMVGFLVWRRSDGRVPAAPALPRQGLRRRRVGDRLRQTRPGRGIRRGRAAGVQGRTRRGPAYRVHPWNISLLSWRADPRKRHGWRQLRMLHPRRIQPFHQRRALRTPVDDLSGGHRVSSNRPLARQAHSASRTLPKTHAGRTPPTPLGRPFRDFNDSCRSQNQNSIGANNRRIFIRQVALALLL